jgi:pyruvate dehydrogenase E1 component alpha subunit
MASIWDLPIIFACENNYYGISGCQKKLMNICNISDRAASYGIPGKTVEGNDVVAVYNAASEAVKRARQGSGPTLLEFTTWRHKGHWEGDPDEWRDPEEHKKWLENDPIARFSNELVKTNEIKIEELEKIEKDVDRELKEAIKFAENSPSPKKEDLYSDIFYG